jgi:hypothetical protein
MRVNDTTIFFMLPTALKAELREWAYRNRLSLSEACRSIIMERLQRDCLSVVSGVVVEFTPLVEAEKGKEIAHADSELLLQPVLGADLPQAPSNGE